MTVKLQRAVRISGAVLAALALGLCMPRQVAAQGTSASPEALCRTLSQQMLDALTRGDSRAASSAFDANMRSALPPDKLAELWRQVQQNYGSLKARGTVQSLQVNGLDVVIIPMRFSRTTLDAQVACNPQQQIAGFFLRPVSA